MIKKNLLIPKLKLSCVCNLKMEAKHLFTISQNGVQNRKKKKNDRGRKVGKRRNKGTAGLGVKNKSNVGKRKENISEEREILR